MNKRNNMHYVLLYNIYHSIPHGCIIPIVSFLLNSFGSLLVSQNISQIEHNHNIILRFLSQLLSINYLLNHTKKFKETALILSIVIIFVLTFFVFVYIHCLKYKKSKKGNYILTCIIPYFLICINVCSGYFYELLSVGIVNSMIKKSVDKTGVSFFNAIKEEKDIQDILVTILNMITFILLIVCNWIYHLFFFYDADYYYKNTPSFC